MKLRQLATSIITCTALAVAGQTAATGVGLQAGVGFAAPTGALRDNFGSCATFTAGLTGAWRSVVLRADVDYSQPSFERQNIFDIRDAQGRDAQLNAAASATCVGLNAQLGYTVLRSGRVSVTPAAGLRWTHYSWNVNDIEWSKNADGQDVFQATRTSHATLSDVGWAASVAVDVRLHTRLVGDAATPRRYVSSVRVTPWLGRASFSRTAPASSGLVIGASLTYAGLLTGF